MSESKNVLTVFEAAEALGVSAKSIRSWISAGRLKCFRAGRLLRVRRDHLEEFMARNAVTAPSESLPTN
jgi:excisionase family DNA binding protein